LNGGGTRTKALIVHDHIAAHSTRLTVIITKQLSMMFTVRVSTNMENRETRENSGNLFFTLEIRENSGNSFSYLKSQGKNQRLIYTFFFTLSKVIISFHNVGSRFIFPYGH